MKRIFCIIILSLILSGCASLSYQAAPDGTTTVTYARFMTGADVIKGKAGNATIEAQGQKTIDPAALQALINILGTAK